MVENPVGHMSDSILFRKLYTKTLTRQVHAENRVQRLMTLQKGVNGIFDNHLVKVRKNLEQDRKRIQKFGEHLAALEKREETTTKATGMFVSDPSQEPSVRTTKNNFTDEDSKTNGFAALLNIHGLEKEFGFARELLLETKERNNGNSNDTPRNTDTPVQNEGQLIETQLNGTDPDPRDVDIILNNSLILRKIEPQTDNSRSAVSRSDAPRSTVGYSTEDPTTFANSERETRFFENTLESNRNSWPKRVSFNDIPLVIAAPTAQEGRTFHSSNSETIWISNFDEAHLDNKEVVLHERFHGDSIEGSFDKVRGERTYEPFHQHHHNSSHGNHDNRQRDIHNSYPQHVPREHFDSRQFQNHSTNHKVQEKRHGFDLNTGHQTMVRRRSSDISDNRVIRNGDHRRHRGRSSSTGGNTVRSWHDRGTLFGHDEDIRAHQIHRPTDHMTHVQTPKIESHGDRDNTWQTHSGREDDENWMKQRYPTSPQTDQRVDGTRAESSPKNSTEVIFDDLSNVPTTDKPSSNPPEDSTPFQEADTLTTARFLKEKTKQDIKFDDWIESQRQANDLKKEMIENKEHEDIVETRGDFNNSIPVADEVLLAMRRQSWAVHDKKDLGKRSKKRGMIPLRISSIFRRRNSTPKAGKTPNVIKGDKKQLNVNKEVRRRMSLRGLPITPISEDEIEHKLFDIADSRYTIADI